MNDRFSPLTVHQWDLLVWHFVARQNERRKPNLKAAGREAGVDPRTAKRLWEQGSQAFEEGRPIRDIRDAVAAGQRPVPVRPLGGGEPTSRLAIQAAKKAGTPIERAPAPPRPARPARTAAPPPVVAVPPPGAAAPPAIAAEDDETDWGGEVGPELGNALADVDFPDAPPPPEPPAPARPPRGPRPLPRRLIEQALRDAEADRLDPGTTAPPMPPEPPPKDYQPLPSEAARAAGSTLAAIDKVWGEAVLLAARHDLVDIAARARRSAALAVYSAQTLLQGIIPLAERVKRDLLTAAESPDTLDADGAIRLMERSLRVARAAAILSTGASAQGKAVTAEIALHLRTIEPAAEGGDDGDLSDEELLARAIHAEDRLRRERERGQQRLREQGGGGGEPPAPAPPVAGEPEAPAPVRPLQEVLTLEALAGLCDVEVQQRGREYLAEGRVDGLAQDGEAVSAVVQGEEPYNTRLWSEGGALVHSCTCPQGQHGRCCKHVVAVGLAWIGRPREAAPEVEEPPGDADETPGEIGSSAKGGT